MSHLILFSDVIENVYLYNLFDVGTLGCYWLFKLCLLYNNEVLCYYLLC